MENLINSCKNCKFHSIKKIPKNVEVVKDDLGLFDEHIKKSDEEIDCFMCVVNKDKHVEVGIKPVMCDAWEKSTSDDERRKKNNSIDDLIRKHEERMRKRNNEQLKDKLKKKWR